MLRILCNVAIVEPSRIKRVIYDAHMYRAWYVHAFMVLNIIQHRIYSYIFANLLLHHYQNRCSDYINICLGKRPGFCYYTDFHLVGSHRSTSNSSALQNSHHKSMTTVKYSRCWNIKQRAEPARRSTGDERNIMFGASAGDNCSLTHFYWIALL